MELRYPERRCDMSPNHAHHFTQMLPTIWRCRYCWVAKWLPIDWTEARAFSDDIRRMGLDRAYHKYLHHKPAIKRILRKLEEIRLLRKVMSEDELMKAIVGIVAITIEEEPKDDNERDFTKLRVSEMENF